MSEVFVVVEHAGGALKKVTLEMLTLARDLGEPVAVVLADDPNVAEQAAALIVAEYDELSAVFDEVEAAQNKILVHEENIVITDGGPRFISPRIGTELPML